MPAKVINAFDVVREELGAEVAVAHSYLAKHVHLSFHHVERPFSPFFGVKEIDSQARDDGTPIAAFLPVDGKGVEIVTLEVHHGI